MRTKVVTVCFFVASLLVLFSPCAMADDFQFDYTTPASGLFSSENIVFTVTAASLPTSGFTDTFTSTNDPLIISFSWNSAAGGLCFSDLSEPGFACAGFAKGTSAGIDLFPAGSFLSPGTYTSLGDGVTVVITDLTTTGVPAVPEPSALLLLCCGMLVLASLYKWAPRSARSVC